jgi:hypothetical protein
LFSYNERFDFDLVENVRNKRNFLFCNIPFRYSLFCSDVIPKKFTNEYEQELLLSEAKFWQFVYISWWVYFIGMIMNLKKEESSHKQHKKEVDELMAKF